MHYHLSWSYKGKKKEKEKKRRLREGERERRLSWAATQWASRARGVGSWPLTLTFPAMGVPHSSPSNRSDAVLSFVNYRLQRRTLIDHARANTSFSLKCPNSPSSWLLRVHILLADAVSPSAFRGFLEFNTLYIIFLSPFHAPITGKRMSFQALIVHGWQPIRGVLTRPCPLTRRSISKYPYNNIYNRQFFMLST